MERTVCMCSAVGTVPLFAGTTFPDTSEALTQMEDAVLQISAAGKPGTTC